MALTPNEIAAGATCFQCLSSTQEQAATLYLLNLILVAQGGTSMTPAEIAAGSVCYQCFDSVQSRAAELYLLNLVVDNGGGGGSAPSGAGYAIQGHGAPSGAPSTINAAYSDSIPWIYSDLDAFGASYPWNVDTQVWIGA